MAANMSQPKRLSRSALLGDAPIGRDCTTFQTEYIADITFSHLYTHEVTEIGIVIAGSGVHRILDQSTPCREGDIYIVPPDTPHAYFSTDPRDPLTVRQLWFCVGDWFDGEVAEHGNPRFCYGVFRDSEIAAYAMLTRRAQNEINILYNTITHEATVRKPEWREAVRAHLAMLLIKLGRYVGDAIKNQPTAPPKEWMFVSAARRAVSERYTDCDLTLSEIAGSLFVSSSHLSRLFKRYTGEAFSEYVRNFRLNRACHLLETTNLNVEEIARQCGLRDIPSFYRTFSAVKGMTPHHYRSTQKSKYIERNNNEKGELIMSILNDICENLQKGKSKIVKELVQQALDEGVEVEKILNEGLLSGMSIVGEKFKNNEVYVPEVLVAARAMNAGTQLLKPYLAQNGIAAAGRVCIGTVQGDLHDIGKNLVKMMMEGKGLEVIDLGTDVSPETFVKTAIEQNCQIICCSALLTTTIGVMEEVVRAAEAAGIRDKVKIMVGGAPVNEEYCKKIGADCYTVDAASAADAAVALCRG